jgi:hypothetical protein
MNENGILMMSSASPLVQYNEIVVSESLSPGVHHLIELSKAYQTIILLYEDDLNDSVLAAWAERDRLKLSTRKIGQVFNGIDVYTFGMDDLPSDTLIELQLREVGQDASRQDTSRVAYKSLLNELIFFQVKILPGMGSHAHLQ